jgi:hypothetical protein
LILDRVLRRIQWRGRCCPKHKPAAREGRAWLGIAHKQLELMHRYMGELGLSPVSRSRVHKLPHLGPKPWEFGSTSEPDEFFDD